MFATHQEGGEHQKLIAEGGRGEDETGQDSDTQTSTLSQEGTGGPVGGMQVAQGLLSGHVDLDEGLVLTFIILLCLLLLAMIVRCVRMVIDPYSAIPTSTWQEEQINN